MLRKLWHCLCWSVLHQDSGKIYYSSNNADLMPKMQLLEDSWHVSYLEAGVEIQWCKSLLRGAVLPGDWDWVFSGGRTMTWTTKVLQQLV
jgi:hypothetical protein